MKWALWLSLDFCLEAVFKFHCRKGNIKSSSPPGLRRQRLDFRKDKAARNGWTKYHRRQKDGEKKTVEIWKWVKWNKMCKMLTFVESVRLGVYFTILFTFCIFENFSLKKVFESKLKVINNYYIKLIYIIWQFLLPS